MRATLLALSLATACAGARVSLPAAAPESAPVADAAGARTVALVRRDAFLVVPTRIDDHPVGDFLIDTGAGATFVDEAVADRLGLPEAVDATVVGALAQSPASLREVHAVSVAGLPLEHDLVMAVDLSDADPMRTFGGIIGFATFGSAPFTIDFAHATLTVHDIARFVPPAGARAESLRINQLPYVEATLDGGIDVWLLLDTGQFAPIVLWQDFVKRHPDVLTVPQKRWATATGIGGGTQVMESELRSIRVFGEEHGKTQVFIQEAPQHGWHHPKVAGRIGMALLDRLRLTIHPAHRRMWIEQP